MPACRARSVLLVPVAAWFNWHSRAARLGNQFEPRPRSHPGPPRSTTPTHPNPDGRMTAEPLLDGRHRALSVIAPCFNEADNLRELAARTLRVFEIKGI